MRRARPVLAGSFAPAGSRTNRAWSRAPEAVSPSRFGTRASQRSGRVAQGCIHRVLKVKKVLSYSPCFIDGAVLVQPRMLLALFASRGGSCSAGCPPGAFQWRCSSASHSPACVAARGYSFPNAGVHLPLLSTARFVLPGPFVHEDNDWSPANLM